MITNSIIYGYKFIGHGHGLPVKSLLFIPAYSTTSDWLLFHQAPSEIQNFFIHPNEEKILASREETIAFGRDWTPTEAWHPDFITPHLLHGRMLFENHSKSSLPALRNVINISPSDPIGLQKLGKSIEVYNLFRDAILKCSNRVSKTEFVVNAAGRAFVYYRDDEECTPEYYVLRRT